MNNPRLVLVILIITVVIGAGVFALQREKPTTWKTYQNKEFGFELKYPSDWVTVFRNPSEFSPDAKLFIGFRRGEITPASPSYADIDVVVQPLDKPIDEPREDYFRGSWRITDGKEIIIDGLKGYYHLFPPSEVVFFEYNKNLYRIGSLSFNYIDLSIKEDIKNVFDGILSRFKFLK